jgi:tetratricopeptide (TPR) repeat protein
MASDKDPVASTSGQPAQAPEATGIQTEPVLGATAATATHAAPPAPPPADIPLPPTRPKPVVVSPEQLAIRLRRLDLLVVAVVVVLAFFLASFIARNSDVWMSLASGRLLAKGDYHFGVDPFSYTTKGAYWVNHSWLYDLISYGLYQLTTDTGLVIFKALLVTALAGVMLASGRRGRSLLIPAVCTALALLAISPLLFLRSTVVSFLFMGVTLCLLLRAGTEDLPLSASARKRKAKHPQVERRHLWLLVPLFLLWVNLDEWFLLGPITVALYGIGDYLQEHLGPAAGVDSLGSRGRRTLILVLLAGTAACLVNPHHYHAFSLPWQLGFSGASDLLRGERSFRPFFKGAVEYYRDGLGWNVAGIGYFVVLVVGIASFAVNHQDWRWGRSVVWLAFAALSAFHQRAIPFFAVVSGPISALNFQDAVARSYGTTLLVTRNWREWSTGSRLAALVGVLALVAVAWPGWLHASWIGIETSSRRVGWRVEADPSLKETAEKLKAWHEQKVIGPDDHGLNLSPDVANYCAWFCPEQKGFIDYRLPLFGGVASDYIKLRQILAFDDVPDQGSGVPPDSPLPGILRQHHINHLVLHYHDPILAQKPLYYFLNDPEKRWSIVEPPDRTLIVGWHAKDMPPPLKGVRYDPDKLAFGPDPLTAPLERPRAPVARPWWEKYVHETGPRSKESHAAVMDLLYFAQLVPRADSDIRRAVLAVSASGLVASPSLDSGSLLRCLATSTQFAPLTRSRMRLSTYSARITQMFTNNGMMQFDEGPTSSLWLAVRHCRRALADNPDDAQAYLRLELAYQRLEGSTRERTFAQLPLIRMLRQVQRINALTNAILLQPDLEIGHYNLAILFEQLGYRDLALKHYKESLRLSQKTGRRLGEAPETFDLRITALDDHVKNLDEQVKKRQNEYETALVGRSSVRNKAEIALRLGLAGQALEMLMHSDDVVLDNDAIKLQLQLMLTTGHIEGKDGIRDTLNEANLQSVLGLADLGRFSLPAHNWLQILTAASSGDYLEADARLEPILEMRDEANQQNMKMSTRSLTFQLLSFELSVPDQMPCRLWWSMERAKSIDRLKLIKTMKPVKADIFILRGILALEAGRNAHARKMFSQALDWADRELEPVARYYLKLLKDNE